MVLGLLAVTILLSRVPIRFVFEGPKANSIYFNFYICFELFFNAGTDGVGTLVDLYHHEGRACYLPFRCLYAWRCWWPELRC